MNFPQRSVAQTIVLGRRVDKNVERRRRWRKEGRKSLPFLFLLNNDPLISMKGRRVKNTKKEEEEEKESAKREKEKKRRCDSSNRGNGAWLDARYFHVDGITVERYMDIHI